jgi:hypothetical protein
MRTLSSLFRNTSTIPDTRMLAKSDPQHPPKRVPKRRLGKVAWKGLHGTDHAVASLPPAPLLGQSASLGSVDVLDVKGGGGGGGVGGGVGRVNLAGETEATDVVAGYIAGNGVRSAG